jgi:ABC-type lipoprotein release transport system permease subunit
MRLKLLPWEYGVRNLFRRPTRSALTLAGLTTVVLLLLLVVGFIRGLERSLAESGDPQVVLVSSLSAGDNLETSSIAARTGPLLSASLAGVQTRHGVKYVSPELYLGTRVALGEGSATTMGIVRGVTTTAALVRRQVEITEGAWPEAGEVLVGRLAPSKLGCSADALRIGQNVTLEGRPWRVCGTFVAGGAAFESEMWCPLTDLQQAAKRQDYSLVAVTMAPSASVSDVTLFCKERVDLELQAVSEVAYYAALQKHYKPVRMLAWIVVILVASAGVFAGLNTMYGAVAGRVRELASLQAFGFRRLAVLVSLVQEASLLSVTAALVASAIALTLVDGAAVRFTMGAFALRIDSVAVLIGCAAGLMLGVLGALPPAWKAMRISVVEGIKAI